eukprot:CAMPEP_0174385594 /NCGR_PEP_ID=MMETSP0811_2-20130205/126707_1 /TAXON_ID=73025 ORGANISM="Eutreptiella gymnastica-like, Strain CCMP1594" /NCGR_SAMPLE_ID=MMETSP0811_2 /ASSEMBLY_ACC=CAM_ASM_000667 /LENGTH=120 /DNA_ID=CAMNT_0015539969 /DNA_START=289 /DNA_END=651 /DNA_ORIENTATION=+
MAHVPHTVDTHQGKDVKQSKEQQTNFGVADTGLDETTSSDATNLLQEAAPQHIFNCARSVQAKILWFHIPFYPFRLQPLPCDTPKRILQCIPHEPPAKGEFALWNQQKGSFPWLPVQTCV